MNGAWPALNANNGGGQNRSGVVYANDVKCLNPWDVQSCRQYAVDGAFPALQAHQGGRYEGVCFALDSMSSNSMKSGNPHSGFHEETVAKTLQAGGVDPTCNQGGNVIVEPLCFKERAGCPGGDKGILINKDGGAFTLSTLNDQTVCIAAFMGGQGAKAKGIGYSENVAPTIKSVMSGGNTVPDVVYALQGNGIDRAETAGCNGKGWRENECYTLNTIDRPAVVYEPKSVMEENWAESDVKNALRANASKSSCAVVYDAPVAVDGYNQTASDKMGSLRAGKSDGDHVGILVYDARGNGNGTTVPTLTGDHQNRVTDYTSVCVMAHGQSNAEITQDMSPTLNCNHEQPIVAMEGSYKGKGHVAEGISPALKAAHPSDIAYGVDCRNVALDEEKTHTLQAKANGGQSLNCTPSVLTNGKPPRRYIVRRLTPLECCRLQGFPDGWADIDRKDDFTDEELDFWRSVRNTHAAINGKQTKEYTKPQMLKWYNGLQSDSSVYKMWGNGIALPCAQYVMEGIALALKGENMDALRL